MTSTSSLIFESPLGSFLLTGSSKGLTHIEFLTAHDEVPGSSRSPLLLLAKQELGLYFSGKLRKFTFPLDLNGTPFQVKVWKQMKSIPWGETMTYGELAKKIGHPQAPRAVGMACRTNPLALAIPCHRVLGQNKKLTGFAFGIENKKWLLSHEGVHL